MDLVFITNPLTCYNMFHMRYHIAQETVQGHVAALIALVELH